MHSFGGILLSIIRETAEENVLRPAAGTAGRYVLYA